MSIFNFYKHIQRSVRMFVRRRMMPMSVDEAEEKREFFAKIYFLSALGIFVCATYKVYQGSINRDRTLPSGEYVVEKLKLDGNIRILRFEDFKITEDYTYVRKGNKNSENQTTDVEQKENINPELFGDIVETNENEALKV